MVQERRDQRGIDLLERQTRRWFAQSLLSEFEQLTEGVAIRADGVRARLSLLH
jgi:hypothetical protein